MSVMMNIVKRGLATAMDSIPEMQSRTLSQVAYTPPKEEIRETDRISSKDLQDLIDNKLGFLKISDYVTPEVSEMACQKLLGEHEIDEYDNAPGVTKISGIGMSFFETMGNQAQAIRYYGMASKSMELGRSIFYPYLSPLDRLRLDLDNEWESGASLLNLGEGKMFSGLIRVLNGDVLAHEDKLERDMGCEKKDISYIAQLAANIYLSMPSEGGELERWPYSLDDETYSRMIGDDYGIHTNRLGERKVEILPSPRDLILFNPRYLHSIRGSRGTGNRITLSTFLLFQGKGKPIGFWS